MIFLNNISKVFIEPDGTSTTVLLNISLKIDVGQLIVIQGPSGCGKTTLLNVISGLLRPTSGQIYFKGVNIANLGTRKLATYRLKHLGYLFQHWRLLPFLNSWENIELPARLLGMPFHEREARLMDLAQSLGIQDRLSNMTEELSGGQKQRVALARALINNPVILLADEPTSAIDSHTRSEIGKILEKMRSKGLGMVITTHDPFFTTIADKIFVFQEKTLISS